MNLILFLFIFPIATIIFSIALQKVLKSPFLVSAIILAIFLIVTFTVYGVNFLIAAFIYALIALITACIVKFFCKIENRTIQVNLINNGNEQENYNSNCGRSSNRNGENNRSCEIDFDIGQNDRSGENNQNCCCNCCRNRNDDPDTEECRICNCQRQFRNCLRRR